MRACITIHAVVTVQPSIFFMSIAASALWSVDRLSGGHGSCASGSRRAALALGHPAKWGWAVPGAEGPCG